MWPVALMAVFAVVAATASSAGAKPPPRPTPVANVEIISFDYGCEFETPFAISVSVTAVAHEDTKLDHVGLGVREYRTVAAGTGGYYPFDTTLDVADWYSHLDRQTVDPKQDSLAMSTNDDFTTDMNSHFWNTVLNPTGEPDPGSWFTIEAWADGSVTQQGNRGGENRWDNDHRQVFLHCATNPPGIFPETGSANSPWEDWNWPNEP